MLFSSPGKRGVHSVTVWAVKLNVEPETFPETGPLSLMTNEATRSHVPVTFASTCLSVITVLWPETTGISTHAPEMFEGVGAGVGVGVGVGIAVGGAVGAVGDDVPHAIAAQLHATPRA